MNKLEIIKTKNTFLFVNWECAKRFNDMGLVFSLWRKKGFHNEGGMINFL